ncbi:MAG: 50S ribosomal protein L25 [Candidatus Omnitrophota bacterium]|jgi:large subunit ribosomal protein L25|nr:MAG: 50S ribosomal protein L25 [Candidatus Omnitrophota bacterium]
MEEIFLDAEIRTQLGKIGVKKLRATSVIPAVIYGEGKDSKAIGIPKKQLLTLVHQHRLENLVINLKIKDENKLRSKTCLIKDIQYDPVQGDIIHVDFNEISLTKSIKVNVPVVAKGEAVGVKQEGGSLEHIMWEIEIECLPTKIPEKIEVDVTPLKIGDSIHVKDIILPPDIKVITPLESVVISVSEPMKEEAPVEEIEGAEAAKEPEVIKEKKEVPAEEKEAEEKQEKKEKK